jgi:hypothetical protein
MGSNNGTSGPTAVENRWTGKHGIAHSVFFAGTKTIKEQNLKASSDGCGNGSNASELDAWIEFNSNCSEGCFEMLLALSIICLM